MCQNSFRRIVSHLSPASTSGYGKTAFSERRFSYISCEHTIILFKYFVNPAIVCGILRFSDILIISYCRGIKRQHSGSFGINFFKNTVTEVGLSYSGKKSLYIYVVGEAKSLHPFTTVHKMLKSMTGFYPSAL